ncbi:MAG: RIP metalloprotease RseP, partial [Pseudomonadota bacterium]
MDVAQPSFLFYIAAFIAVLSVLVFIHEMGHYLMGRAFNVKVDSFSIGFGKELIGWTDKHDTRWKLSAIPLGGYVKFYGDASAASNPDADIDSISPEERAVTLHYKPLYQRALVVVAGPAINFLFAILIYAALFVMYGQPYTPAVVTAVLEDSPAAIAGIEPGDRIVALDGQSVDRFEDLLQMVHIRANQRVPVSIDRDGEVIGLTVQLAQVEQVDRFGNRYLIGRLGINGSQQAVAERGVFSALYHATLQTGSLVRMMARTIGEMILGKRSLDELGGPVKIAKLSGETASLGILPLINLIALISINLGFINLLPIPMLDGGHLAFYAYEAIRGKPADAKAQELAFLAGLTMVLCLFVLLTVNDLNNLRVWDGLTRLFS